MRCTGCYPLVHQNRNIRRRDHICSHMHGSGSKKSAIFVRSSVATRRTRIYVTLPRGDGNIRNFSACTRRYRVVRTNIGDYLRSLGYPMWIPVVEETAGPRSEVTGCPRCDPRQSADFSPSPNTGFKKTLETIIIRYY